MTTTMTTDRKVYSVSRQCSYGDKIMTLDLIEEFMIIVSFPVVGIILIEGRNLLYNDVGYINPGDGMIIGLLIGIFVFIIYGCVSAIREELAKGR